MVSGSPPPPAHEVLSEPPSYTRTCLRGRRAADHEDYKGSRVSPWVGGPWTLQGQLVGHTYSMVEVYIGHSLCGLLCRKRACRP